MTPPGVRAGLLRDRVRIERQTGGKDAHGGRGGEWTVLGERWAQYLPGTGQERREAAQERATVAATFRLRRDALTASLTAADRLRFDPFAPLGAEPPAWDIAGIVPFGRDGVDITATSSPNQGG